MFIIVGHLITHVSPLGSMDMLSQLEVDMLKRTASSDLYQLYRSLLAVRLSISTSSCDSISIEPSGLTCVIK
jgi:hypothetical protein